MCLPGSRSSAGIELAAWRWCCSFYLLLFEETLHFLAACVEAHCNFFPSQCSGINLGAFILLLFCLFSKECGISLPHPIHQLPLTLHSEQRWATGHVPSCPRGDHGAKQMQKERASMSLNFRIEISNLWPNISLKVLKFWFGGYLKHDS